MYDKQTQSNIEKKVYGEQRGNKTKQNKNNNDASHASTSQQWIECIDRASYLPTTQREMRHGPCAPIQVNLLVIEC